MTDDKFVMRVGAIGGGAAAGLLAVMMGVGASIGADFSNLGDSLVPRTVAHLFAAYRGEIQTLMVVDNLFVLGYLVAFIGLATATRRRAPLFAGIALGFALATGVLDFLENSLTLGLLGVVTQNQTLFTAPTLTSESVLGLNLLGQVKYLCANVAVVLFGIGMWSAERLHRVTAILFWLFAPLNVLAFVVPAFAAARILGMFALLILGAVVLGRQARAVE